RGRLKDRRVRPFRVGSYPGRRDRGEGGMTTLEECSAVVSALVQRRVELGRRQAEVARAAGIKPPNLSLYERGLRNPSLPRLLAWARALQYEIRFEASA